MHMDGGPSPLEKGAASWTEDLVEGRGRPPDQMRDGWWIALMADGLVYSLGMHRPWHARWPTELQHGRSGGAASYLRWQHSACSCVQSGRVSRSGMHLERLICGGGAWMMVDE